MLEPRAPTRSTLWTTRALALACVLLAAICVGLTLAWRAERETAGCFRAALANGETPAVADADCLDPPAR